MTGRNGIRRQLGPMPRVHLETAIGQFAGTIALVNGEVDPRTWISGSRQRSGIALPTALNARISVIPLDRHSSPATQTRVQTRGVTGCGASV